MANKHKVVETGKGRTTRRPKEEWIVVPNSHEPLVTEEDFAKAQLVLPRQRYDSPELVFGKKIRCPFCGHAMTYTSVKNPRYKCPTIKMTDHYGCKDTRILHSVIEKAVLDSIKEYIGVVLDNEEIKLERILKSKLSVKGLENKITTENKAIEMLEASVTKIFTSFASGKMTKEAFLHKKEVINDTIERKRSSVEKMSDQLRELTLGRVETETAIEELDKLRNLESLNREIVALLIDRILVHGEETIEIIWNGEFAGQID